jgi:predicted nucleic acid-binding protein
MSDRPFLDTNVLIYAIAQDDPRAAVAEALLGQGGVVSVHVLNEFVAVARRKLGLSWEEVLDALGAIRALCAPPVPITAETHERAVQIAAGHDLHIYDALVVSAALQAECAILYSEDMQDGRVFDGRLTLRNPFGSNAAV